MRRAYVSVSPDRVHQLARSFLADAVVWQAYRRSVSVADLLRLLLIMASTGRSLFATVVRRFTFSHETARRAVRANLPTVAELTRSLVDSLHAAMQLSARDRRRHWTLAIDTHGVPYYGARTPAVIGGPRKAGTKYSFGYATAVLTHRHRRYTVAVCPLSPGDKPHQIVERLLDQVSRTGLRIRGVALDSGFDSGDVLLLLQSRRLAYVVPLRRKGRGDNQRNRLFAGRDRLIRWAAWITDLSRRPVRTRTVLLRQPKRTMLLAFDGWNENRARSVHQQARHAHQTYRDRFGIETSYRQKNQAQPPTCSRDPAYRLLLQGVALLLRQAWVRLTAELAAAGHDRADGWVATLTLADVLEHLRQTTADTPPTQIPTPPPIINQQTR